MRTLTTDIPRTLCENAARTGDVVERSTAEIGLPSPQRSTFPRYTCARVSRETARPASLTFTMTLNASAAPAGRGPASAMRTRVAASLLFMTSTSLLQEARHRHPASITGNGSPGLQGRCHGASPNACSDLVGVVAGRGRAV